MDLGHWHLSEGLEYKEDAFGFIYEIHCVINNKKYIGKKQCISKVKRPPLKGKKKCRRSTKESDWKTYTGSSNELNADIARYGKDKFTFTILQWGNSKFELGYFELKRQILEDVLLKEGYYNGIVNARLSKPKNYVYNSQNLS
jgi:hypothetical protein